MGEVFEIMKRASIFMILAQTVIYFRPNECYEKYLKLLVHVMMLVVLFFPVVGLLSKDAGARMESSFAFYSGQVEQVLYGTEWETSQSDDAYLSTIEDEVKTKLNKYEEETGYTVESAEIIGFSQEPEGLAEKSVRLLLFVKPSSDAVCTVEVDKVKCGDNTEKVRIAPKSEGEGLAEQYAAYLGMNSRQVEVRADGVD